MGAAKHKASTRSSSPVAPVTDLPSRPQLVIPRSRLMAFITKCPNEPDMHAISAMATAWPGLNGVSPLSTLPTRLATPTANAQVRQLKLLLTRGALDWRGQRRLAKCCTSMQLCTTSTKKIPEMHFSPRNPETPTAAALAHG